MMVLKWNELNLFYIILLYTYTGDGDGNGDMCKFEYWPCSVYLAVCVLSDENQRIFLFFSKKGK